MRSYRNVDQRRFANNPNLDRFASSVDNLIRAFDRGIPFTRGAIASSTLNKYWTDVYHGMGYPPKGYILLYADAPNDVYVQAVDKEKMKVWSNNTVNAIFWVF